jgi:hypothetical protein
MWKHTKFNQIMTCKSITIHELTQHYPKFNTQLLWALRTGTIVPYSTLHGLTGQTPLSNIKFSNTLHCPIFNHDELSEHPPLSNIQLSISSANIMDSPIFNNLWAVWPWTPSLVQYLTIHQFSGHPQFSNIQLSSAHPTPSIVQYWTIHELT